MTVPSAFILTAMIVLALIGIFIFLVKPPDEHRRLSLPASLALFCIIAGMVFGETRWLGYGLLTTGALLAAADIIIKYKKRK
ncbi:MAG: hypothetical protein K2X48_00365 [Chitinophagaceae bacterium]|nr:hypothetical protein [Chitinophagaceae bacterium]